MEIAPLLYYILFVDPWRGASSVRAMHFNFATIDLLDNDFSFRMCQ
jgi:hypothetical protein